MEDSYFKQIQDKIGEIEQQLHDFRTKFVYYILAVDAACIGFAVNYNKDIHLSYLVAPFILAVIFWLISFYYGIKEIQLMDLIILTNHKIFKSLQNDNINLDLYVDELLEFNGKFKKISRYKIWFLYVGAILFLLFFFLKVFFNC